MEPPVFYAPPESKSDDTIILPSDEAKHAFAVMRLRAGAIVCVVDGLGTGYRGEIVSATKAKVSIRIHSEQRNFGEPNVRVTLAAALSVGTKPDSIIARSTELGVKRFVPLLSEKSKIQLDDPKRAASKVKRLRRVAMAAMKQCRRSYCPEIAMPIAFNEMIKQAEDNDVNILFHPGVMAKPFDTLKISDDCRRVLIITGPESGFSDTEIERAQEAGYNIISLGSRVLRTETAAPVALALVMARLGELS